MTQRLLSIVFIVVFVLSSCSTPPVPISSPTSTPSIAPTQSSQLMLLQNSKLFSGPGNLGFEIMADLTKGELVRPLGVYHDFVLVETGSQVRGYVFKGDLEASGNDIPELASSEVPLISQDLLPLFSGGKTSVNNGIAMIDNSQSTEWFGQSLGRLDTTSNFQLVIQASFNGDFGAILVYGSLPGTGKEMRPKMIILPDGRIQFQNGADYNTFEIKVDLPKEKPFIVKFNDPNGKFVTFADADGNEIHTIDVTKDLPNIPAPDGLFPYKQLYIDVQTSPGSSLTISKFLLQSTPEGIYDPALENPCTIIAGERETVLTNQALSDKGLSYWPDGVMGVLRTDADYQFFAGNSRLVGVANGTLENPISNSAFPEIKIKNLKESFTYASGGPVYRDASGMLLMIYHAENDVTLGSETFYSYLGMAKSTDNGNTWIDLGLFITPEIVDNISYAEDVGSGPFVIVGDYIYVYFKDTLKMVDTRYDVNFAVARAKLVDVVQAARDSDAVVSWSKYYHGAWEEPGLGGRSDPIETGDLPTSNFDVAYDSTTHKFVAIITGNLNDHMKLYYIESTDGIHWSARQPVDISEGEQVYPTIIGLENDPKSPGASFYVYYLHTPSWQPEIRFSASILARKLITCAGK